MSSTIIRGLWRRPWFLLLLGMSFVAVAHLRGGIGLFAWVAPVPFLRYLRLTRGVQSRLGLFGALAGAWSLAFLKIADPFPVAAIPMWGIGLALFQVVPYLAHDALARRLSPGLATLVFPAALATAEWAQHAGHPAADAGVDHPALVAAQGRLRAPRAARRRGASPAGVRLPVRARRRAHRHGHRQRDLDASRAAFGSLPARAARSARRHTRCARRPRARCSPIARSRSARSRSCSASRSRARSRARTSAGPGARPRRRVPPIRAARRDPMTPCRERTPRVREGA